MAKKNKNLALVDESGEREAITAEHDDPPVTLDIATMSFDDLARGSGYIDEPDIIKDKNALVGVELVVIDARVNEEGDFGPFVSLTCLLRDRSKVVINDGSTGIYRQWVDGGLSAPLYCKQGLRMSEYDYEGRPARTFYLTGGQFKAA